MITPTVGRIVWYTPTQRDTMIVLGPQPLAAIVAYVWGNSLVNLHVIDHNGAGHFRTKVPLIQDGDPAREGGGDYAEWMPYQKGQAAKTEQFEKAAAFARREPMPLA